MARDARRKIRKARNPDARLKEELRKENKVLHEGMDYIRKHLDKLWEYATEGRERLQDLEIQVNLLTRLLTALALQTLKMKPKALRRMIKQVEEEAVADSQVKHLEELFRMEAHDRDKGSGEGRHKKG